MSLERALVFLPFAPVVAALALAASCVPPGNAPPSDAGTTTSAATPAAPTARPSINVMTASFEDNFDRANTLAPSAALLSLEASTTGEASSPTNAGSLLGASWAQAGTDVWHIDNGRLCGAGAKNHGVWLAKTLPINARIEFDAISDVEDGDIKCEVWGDGRSAATGISYTNATSYIVIFGGWHNTIHALARINEHGKDRQEIKVEKDTDDPREKPVTAGQIYHFKIERTDGKTVKWSVNGTDMLSYVDPAPLTGMGHDHFGFNDWDAKVCFDNVKVTPLP